MRRGGFSIKASHLSQQQAGGRPAPAPGRRDPECSMMGSLPLLLSATLLQAPTESIRTSSDGVRECQIPVSAGVIPLPNCTPRVCLFPSHFTVWDPKPSAVEQIERSLLSYLFSEQNPYLLPRETWQSSPSAATSPARSLASGCSRDRTSLPLHLLQDHHRCCHPSAL